MQSPPDLIEGQGHLFEPHTESDYATMKFHPDPVAKAHYLEQQQATAQVFSYCSAQAHCRSIERTS